MRFTRQTSRHYMGSPLASPPSVAAWPGRPSWGAGGSRNSREVREIAPLDRVRAGAPRQAQGANVRSTSRRSVIRRDMAYRVPFDELAWQPCGAGVREKVHRCADQVLRLVEYGADMPPHWCERGHIGTILVGRFEIEFASGTHVFEAGDGVDIPAGHAHRHRARALTERVTALFVETPSPPDGGQALTDDERFTQA